MLAETLAGYENVELVFGDVLALDLPQLVAERFAGLRPVVCANLPYNVTSPLLTAFLTAGCFDTVTVMIQREVAHRLCARPGTADYGRADRVRPRGTPSRSCCSTCRRTALFPRRRSRAPSCGCACASRTACRTCRMKQLLFAVVRAAFSQRRKTLINALAAGVPGCDKARAAAAVAACGFDARVRGETLEPGAVRRVERRARQRARQ